MLSIIYFFVGWVSCYYFLSEQRTAKFRNSNFKSPPIESSYEKLKEDLALFQKQEETLQHNIYNDDDLVFFVNDSPYDDLDLSLDEEDDDDLSLDLSLDEEDGFLLPSYDDDWNLSLSINDDDDLSFLLDNNDPLDLPDFDELEFHLEFDSLLARKSAVKEEVCWWKEGF